MILEIFVDDRCVLDCDTCNAGSLLRVASVGGVQQVEIHGCRDPDMGLECSVDS